LKTQAGRISCYAFKNPCTIGLKPVISRILVLLFVVEMRLINTHAESIIREEDK